MANFPNPQEVYTQVKAMADSNYRQTGRKTIPTMYAMIAAHNQVYGDDSSAGIDFDRVTAKRIMDPNNSSEANSTRFMLGLIHFLRIRANTSTG